MKFPIRFFTLFFLAMMFILSIILIGKELYTYHASTRMLDKKMHAYAQQKIELATQKIGVKLRGYIKTAHEAAQKLENETWTSSTLDAFLEKTLENNPDFRAIGTAFEPYKFDLSRKLYLTVFLRAGGKIIKNEPYYDYTLPSEKSGAKTEWYRNFINKGRGWTEPYFGTGANQEIITYSTSFSSPTNKPNPLGVLSIDIPLDYVNDIVRNLALTQTCFGFLISKKGTILSRPSEKYFRNELTIFDIDEDEHLSVLKNIKNGVFNGTHTYKNKNSGQQSILCYQLIPGTDLILELFFSKNELFPAQWLALEQRQTNIFSILLICLLLLFSLFICFLKNKKTAFASCLIVTMGIGLLLAGKELYRLTTLYHSLNTKLNEYASQQIDAATRKISAKFQEYTNIVRTAATHLSKKSLDPQELDHFLEMTLKNNPSIKTMGAAFKPYMLDKKTKLYARYFKREGDILVAANTNYDYTLPSEKAGDNTDWFVNFIESDAGWTTPYFDVQDQINLMSCSSKFFSPTSPKKSIGVVEIDLTLDHIQEVIDNLALSTRSYGFLLSPHKALVSYSHAKEQSGLTEIDIDKSLDTSFLSKHTSDFFAQKNGCLSYKNELSKQESIIYFKMIPNMNLIFGIVSNKDEFFSIASSFIQSTKKRLNLAILLILISLITLFMLLLKTNQQRITICLGVLFVIGLFLTGREIYISSTIDRSLDAKMHEYAQQQIDDVTKHVSEKFQFCTQLVRDMAKKLSAQTWNDQSLRQFITSHVENLPNITGVAVAFEPYAFEKSKRLYSLGYIPQKRSFLSDEEKYDYTLPTEKVLVHTEWYRNFIHAKEGWTEPYWEADYQDNIISCCSPFYSPATMNKSIGVLAVDLSLDHVRKWINRLALGKMGYGFVISKQGTFVAHPIEDFYRKELNFFEETKKQTTPFPIAINKQILKKSSGYISYKESKTGRDFVLFYKTIPGANLIMALVFLKDEFFAKQQSLVRQTKIKITIESIFCLLLLLLLLILFVPRNPLILISCAVAASLFLLGGIGYFWAIKWNQDPNEEQNQTLIFDQSAINKTITEGSHTTQPTIIKMGVYLDQIEQLSNTSIYISGKVWQKYPRPRPATIMHDFFIPQGKTAFQKTLLSQEQTETEDIFVWQVTGELWQDNLLSREFPFDTQSIKIFFEHPSLDANILMVPDLESYKIITPQTFPGIAKTMSILDWVMQKTLFSFKKIYETVHLGLKAENRSKQLLCFTVQAKRNLFGYLIMYFLPLMVSMLLLFFNLCLIKFDRVITSLSITSGIFLGLIFAHSAIRKIEISSSILYLEYFYIIPYLLMSLLLINVFFYAQKNPPYFIKYRNNFFTKALFWPLFLFIMLLITGWMFW